MKITVITSNQPRHNYLINSLSKICTHLFVIQEVSNHYSYTNKHVQNNLYTKYFKHVIKAEKKIFDFQNIKSRNISILTIPKGDLNNYSSNLLKSFLKSKYYIVFGSSIIRGPLLRYLIKKKAINIHMGISPYYRGADCNFWALYDNNYELVGGTVIRLSKKIDAGDILFHNLAKYKKNKFEYTMHSVKTTINKLIEVIRTSKLNKIRPIKQNLKNTIRKSHKKDFNETVIKKFFLKKELIKKNKKITL